MFDAPKNNDLKARIDNLSPAKRALLENRLRERQVVSELTGKIPTRPTGLQPLSLPQRHLWFLTQFDAQNPANNRPSAFCIEKPFDNE
jgi:hypothetical protein